MKKIKIAYIGKQENVDGKDPILLFNVIETEDEENFPQGTTISSFRILSFLLKKEHDFIEYKTIANPLYKS